jgi:hypothetical protein
MMLNDTENNASSFLLKKKITILQTVADAHKKKWESLSPEDKELFDKNHSAAQNKYCKSLTLDQKAQEF